MIVTDQPTYTAFGLTVGSEIRLPELPETSVSDDRTPDVQIRLGAVDPPADAVDGQAYAAPNDGRYVLFEAAAVSIRGGAEIVVDPAPDVPDEIVRHLVVGPALNHLLHQRGYFVLHASTVAIGEVAVAFVGESGAGKTTTAAAFLREGYRILSDDVAAIKNVRDPSVVAGFPAIKIEPTTANRFDLPVNPPTHTCAARDRHFHSVEYELPSSPVPLERIYVLEDADRDAIAPIGSAEGVVSIVENTYTSTLLGENSRARSNFTQSATLADSASIRRLRRRRRFESLQAVVRLVTEDIEGTT